MSAIGGVTDRGLNLAMLGGGGGGGGGGGLRSPLQAQRTLAAAKGSAKAAKAPAPSKTRKARPAALYLYIQMEFCEGLTLREVIDKVRGRVRLAVVVVRLRFLLAHRRRVGYVSQVSSTATSSRLTFSLTLKVRLERHLSCPSCVFLLVLTWAVFWYCAFTCRLLSS